MFKAKWCGLVLAAVSLLSCSGGSSPSEDTFEIVPVDVVLFGPQDGVPQEATIEDALTPELFADSLPGQDGLAVEAAAELPQPLDVTVELQSEVLTDITDVTQLPDLPGDLQPDLAVDSGFVDAGTCGQCPVSKPNCQNGVCTCDGESCGLGFYCKGGACVPCNVDLHCGLACESCGAQGKWCAADGAGCVKCDDVAHFCQDGEACIEGECVNCEGLGFCGPQCIQCGEKSPDCVDGVCVCNPESCGVSHVCQDDVCVECTPTDPAHCGGDCLVCAGDTPHCMDGACTFCDTDEQCGPACQSCGETQCAPDASGCVECLEDGHCADLFICDESFHCVPDCIAPTGCASDLSPSRKKCSEAWVIGRVDAKDGAHLVGDTYQESNDDDLNYFLEHSECWDASYDHFYRIYLLPGETISVLLVPKEQWFDAMLKLYTGTECDENDAGIFSSNDKYLIQCWNDDGDGDPENFSYQVAEEGWYTIVVDGRQSGEDEDWGMYELDITLTCTQDNCCCP